MLLSEYVCWYTRMSMAPTVFKYSTSIFLFCRLTEYSNNIFGIRIFYSFLRSVYNILVCTYNWSSKSPCILPRECLAHQRVAVFDASAKYPTGLLVNNGYELGAFDECLRVSAELEEGPVRGQYCLVDIHFRRNTTLPPNWSLDYDPLASAWLKLRVCQFQQQTRLVAFLSKGNRIYGGKAT